MKIQSEIHPLTEKYAAAKVFGAVSEPKNPKTHPGQRHRWWGKGIRLPFACVQCTHVWVSGLPLATPAPKSSPPLPALEALKPFPY